MSHAGDHSGSRRSLLRGLALGVLAAFPGQSWAQDAPAPPADLQKILKQMGETQANLRTLRADFVQEKTLELLAAPDVARGQITYEAPHRILWEYREPEPTVLLIDEKTLMAYYPDLKKADRVDIGEKRQRYDRYFGVALGSEGPIQEHFEVSLARETDLPGTHLLVLAPKSKRIEKYLTEIRLWVDVESHLPRRFEYREENGDATSYTLTNLSANEALPPDLFTLKLPPDVEVTDVTGGFKSRRARGL